MDISKLISQIASAAEAVAVAVVPGGKEMVQAAHSMIGLIDEAQATFGSDADSLSEGREALEAAVNAHADRTAGSLG